MKTLKGLLILFSALFAGAFAFAFTGNVIAGMAATSLFMHVAVYITGYQFDASQFVLSTLVSIPATAPGVGNPGGGRKLYLAAVEAFTQEYPLSEDILEGEVITAPTLTAGETFIEVAISDNSLKIDHQLTGPAGYQSYEHMLEVKIAGYNKIQTAAIEKLLNRQVVAVAVLNDGQRVMVGTNYLGLDLEIVHTTDARGTGRREWTIKGKQSGYMWGVLPLKDTVVIPGMTA